MDLSVDIRMAKAMAHPIRANALRILNQRVASPSDIARELELPVANVSYHINTLLRLGCIEEVEHRHVRGAIEHRYKAVRPPLAELPDIASLPETVRHSLLGTVFANAMKDAVTALERGTASKREDVHWTFTQLDLDQEGWDKLYSVLRATLDDVEQIKAEAGERIKQGATAIPATVTMLHYERSPES